MNRLVVAGALTAVLAGACNGGISAANGPLSAATSPASVMSIQSKAPATPRITLPDRSPGQPSGPSSSPAPQDVHPIGWHATVNVIDPATRARMKYSWHQGCPVPIRNLRLIRMSYLGFDRETHIGEMVVHKNVAADVVKVLHRMFNAGYPIRRMRLVDDYRGDDDRSMAADNTSAFNCRPVTGGTEWSQHSYGWAIDINPIENPYVTPGGKVLPPAGRKYVDRRGKARGVIHHGDVVWRAFRSVGWGWGGDWHSIRDYQHFSLTGR
jgi:D-alanyl-D-alanine carboxypeptidase-like protein